MHYQWSSEKNHLKWPCKASFFFTKFFLKTRNQQINFVDIMALIRTMVQIPSTFEEVAVGMISYIPKGYARVDLVADCYFHGSVKDTERHSCGESDSRRILIKSICAKVLTSDFASFLSNGENKTRMIQVIFEFIVKHNAKILHVLRTTVLILPQKMSTRR